MHVAGTVTLTAYLDPSHKTLIEALVCSEVRDAMLVSWHDLISLGVLHRDFPKRIVRQASTESIELREKMAQLFPTVLSDEPSDAPMNDQPPMRILLNKENIVPTRVCTPRRIPLRYEEEAAKTIQDLLDRGVIAIPSPARTTSFWPFPATRKFSLDWMQCTAIFS